MKRLIFFLLLLCLAGCGSEAYNNRGISWDEKGEYDKAIADYSAHIRLKPDDGYRAYLGRAVAYGSKGDRVSYERDLSQAKLRGYKDPE